eukprot:3124843-Prymnesium_polylepis.1
MQRAAERGDACRTESVARKPQRAQPDADVLKRHQVGQKAEDGGREATLGEQQHGSQHFVLAHAEPLKQRALGLHAQHPETLGELRVKLTAAQGERGLELCGWARDLCYDGEKRLWRQQQNVARWRRRAPWLRLVAIVARARPWRPRTQGCEARHQPRRGADGSQTSREDAQQQAATKQQRQWRRVAQPA